MKIGILSDAHGNPIALATCLQQLKALQVDRIYFLGDAVGYLPGEGKVLELLRVASVFCQKGNHEAMLLGEVPLSSSRERIYRIEAARGRLSKADLEFVADWPEHRVVYVGGRKLLLVHGSPDNHLQGYVYPDSNLSIFDGLDYDAVFMGHTHYPFASQRQWMLVVNVGSCGIPRDQGDLSAFAVYDPDTNSCEIFRLHFNSNKIIGHFGMECMAVEVYQCLLRKASSPVFSQRLDGECEWDL